MQVSCSLGPHLRGALRCTTPAAHLLLEDSPELTAHAAAHTSHQTCSGLELAVTLICSFLRASCSVGPRLRGALRCTTPAAPSLPENSPELAGRAAAHSLSQSLSVPLSTVSGLDSRVTDSCASAAR